MSTSIEQFLSSLKREAPPAGVSDPLLALWHDAKGDWHSAHELVQSDDDGDGAWVHAYLHRKEGDISNAGYWYRQARKPKPPSSLSLDEEWNSIVETLLENQ